MYMSITLWVGSTLRSCSVVLGSLKKRMATNVSFQSVLKIPKDSCTFHARSQQQIFTVTALLRYNSHAIQGSYLKGTSQCFLVHSQNCTTIPTFNFYHNHFRLSPRPPPRKTSPSTSCLSGLAPSTVRNVYQVRPWRSISFTFYRYFPHLAPKCYFIVLARHVLLIRLSAGRHWSYSYLWATMGNAATKIHAQVSVLAYVFISFGHIPGSGAAGSSNSTFDLLGSGNRPEIHEASGNESFRKTTLFYALTQGTISHRGAG